MARPIRSAQIISPFGVGAMMDFPGPESLIQAGLDAWPTSVVNDPARRITNEARLAGSLGVSFFVTPPPYDVNKPDTKSPWLRFPRWHFCPVPGCGLMKEATLHEHSPPHCQGHEGKRKPTMLQMRFVAACANGHLRDFPWEEWLADRDADGGRSADQIRSARASGEATLRLRNTGETGGMGVRVELVGRTREVIVARTLANAFGGNPEGDTPLSSIGVACRGENPAIAVSPGAPDCRDCSAPLVVLLRGAGNLYFSDVASAIHIPDRIPGNLSEELNELFEDDTFVRRLLLEAGRSNDGLLHVNEAAEVFSDHSWIQASSADISLFVDAFNKLEPMRQLGKMYSHIKGLHECDALTEEALLQLLAKIEIDGRPLKRWDILPKSLSARVNELLSDANDKATGTEQPDDPRTREFMVFSQKQAEVEGMPKSILKLRSQPISNYGNIVSRHFEHVSLLDTLRETRVLKGFNRIYARERKPEDYLELLWRDVPRKEDRWLPATLVYGEGIFLGFRHEAIKEWESGHSHRHIGRLAEVKRSMEELATRRGIPAESPHPRRVLIHTFAHLLINQLIFDSGYGSSSLRERLYFREPEGDDPGMAGLLIYTAAGDSEGSMGGLVRMGEPGRLEGVIRRALENAMWCSSDPVCIESTGQGPDNCNLAACHSCALLPETSCELQNRLLDRGTVIGTLEHPDCGYFSGA